VSAAGYFSAMLGYIIGIILALLLVTFVYAGMSVAGPRVGRKTGEGKPLQPEGPAADEPTPDRSVTARPRQINAARSHTPPG
jgi:hypothetical protein